MTVLSTPLAQCSGRTSRRAAVLHHRRPHPRTTVVRRRRPHRVPRARRPRPGQASLCAAPAAPRACARARPRRRRAQHHPAPARPRQRRHHLDLPAGDRPRGDHHGRAHAPHADDVRQCRAAALIESPATLSGSATALPLRPSRSERLGGPAHTIEPRALRKRAMGCGYGRPNPPGDDWTVGPQRVHSLRHGLGGWRRFSYASVTAHATEEET
jgi:hypothetical protein